MGPRGPILDFWVSVSEPRRRAMAAAAVDAPGWMKLQFLLDSGADTTMINDMHMRSLGIAKRGSRDIRTVTTDAYATTCDTFDIALKIETYGDQPFIIPAIEVMGRPFHNEMIDGLIARDVLDRVVLTLDGPGKKFVLHY